MLRKIESRTKAERKNIIPCTTYQDLEAESILAVSGVASDLGIGYGGIDKSGSENPEVKEEIFSCGDGQSYWY